MIWVAFVALIVSLGVNVSLAVLVWHQSVETVRALDASHQRTVDHTNGLVDRLMAMDFTTYKAYEMTNGPHIPDAPSIEEIEMVQVAGPDRGGFGSKLGLKRPLPDDDEEPQ